MNVRHDVGGSGKPRFHQTALVHAAFGAVFIIEANCDGPDSRPELSECEQDPALGPLLYFLGQASITASYVDLHGFLLVGTRAPRPHTRTI